MIKKAVRMKIFPDMYNEYEKRHKEIWPEMKEMLKEHGCISYTIWLDKSTSYLFAYMEIEDELKWQATAETEINQKWWYYMKDVMETQVDYSPTTVTLNQVFDLFE
ncbi:L-rhamnose mutarotase [Lactococcus sp.]|uniref:L-rhamnose mutarotase n=1 Tax=Lactococcus sp. TaxID=44273 RepID=UPI0035AE1065